MLGWGVGDDEERGRPHLLHAVTHLPDQPPGASTTSNSLRPITTAPVSPVVRSRICVSTSS